jgi:hypothetical protein
MSRGSNQSNRGGLEGLAYKQAEPLLKVVHISDKYGKIIIGLCLFQIALFACHFLFGHWITSDEKIETFFYTVWFGPTALMAIVTSVVKSSD